MYLYYMEKENMILYVCEREPETVVYGSLMHIMPPMCIPECSILLH